MAINSTGKPDTRDYFLGRGIVYLAELDANLLPVSWRDLGNSPAFSITVESEELLHQSSRTGLRITDKRITLSQDISLSFQIDELSHDNLALFFTGDTVSLTNPAVAGVASMGSPVAITANAELGKWYDLKTVYSGVHESPGGTSVKTAFSADSVPKIRRTSGVPMDLVLGTDYEIDRFMGRVFVKSNATNVAAGDDIAWYSAADATAPATLQVMRALKGSVRDFALKFVAENPANSAEKIEYDFHSVQISADGDLSLIGDEFSVAGFTGSAQKNSNINVDATLTVRASVRA
jgi:hypothetical protein